MSLQFSTDTSARYVAVSEITKDFRFEQPTLDKLREEQSTTLTRMEFTQNVVGVDEAGGATLRVTIDALHVLVTNKNDVRVEFDSRNEGDRANALFNLIGQQYTVQLTGQGEVVGFDAQDAKRAVPGSTEARLVERILGDAGIKERHEVPALRSADAAAGAKKTWTQEVASPPGLLTPKSFVKTYTFGGVQTQNGRKVAVVEMNARESADPAGGQASPAAMGVFARMFDSHDAYTGKLLLTLDSGEVLDYNETLISTYIAQDMPANADPNKGPDTLTMRFTHRVELKKL
jgi:hypothetical protein